MQATKQTKIMPAAISALIFHFPSQFTSLVVIHSKTSKLKTQAPHRPARQNSPSFVSPSLIVRRKVRRRPIIPTSRRDKVHGAIRRRGFLRDPVIPVHLPLLFQLLVDLVVNRNEFPIRLHHELLVLDRKVIFEIVEVVLDQLLLLARFLFWVRMSDNRKRGEM